MKPTDLEVYVTHNLKACRARECMALIAGYDDYEEKSVYKFYSRYGEEILEQIDKAARSCNKNIFEFLHHSMTARDIDITAKKHEEYPNHVFHKVLIIEGLCLKALELEEKAQIKESRAAGKDSGRGKD